jgi:hypothetical protein
LYSGPLPPGFEALGTVRRGIGDEGALCRIQATGIYVQLNAGALRTLPQREVREALRVVGQFEAVD